MEASRTCDGQCQKCSLIQQTYCSAVRLYTLMQHEEALFERIGHLEEKMDSLDKRFAQSEELIIAQGGGGAEKATKKQTTINE